MNYVIVSGYICSGSSIINDLLKEVKGYKDFPIEFKLLRDPSGLLELEKLLFTDWDHLNTACALERFEQFCDKMVTIDSNVWRHDKCFCEEFREVVNVFINEIAGEKYDCGTSYFTLENKEIMEFKKGDKTISLSKKGDAHKEVRLCDVTRDEFYEASQRLIDRIFSHYKEQGYHSIILDQGLPVTSAHLLKNYFPQGKMIIVDRDPRDTALSMIQRGKGIGMHLGQSLDADLYVRWFKKTRSAGMKIDDPNILYFTYEELILEYEKCRKKLFEFMGIDQSEHIEQYKYYNPRVSAKRIGKWKSYTNEIRFTRVDWLEFCKKVGEELDEYCYNGDVLI